MLIPKVILSDTYQRRLAEIENFIWESSGKSILALEVFLTAHDQVLEFLKKNPKTPATHPQTGDQSWPFGDGRYRLFFKFNNANIELLDLIDNRMSNLKIYPNNVLPTYDVDE
jgi:hypothetical protein